MRAEKEYRAVAIENILRPVAVMNVPIGDQNPAHAMLLLGVTRRDCHGVEDAEAHAAYRVGMMARRPPDADGVGNSLLDNRVHRVKSLARRAQRSIQRFWRNGGVAGAQLVKAFEDLAFGQLNIRARVA